MSRRRSQTTQSATQNTAFNNNFANQNQFDWMQTPDSPDIAAYRGWKPEIDPSISHRFGRARTKLNESFDAPMGQYTTPAIREATQRAAEGDLMQQEGQANREGQYDVNNQRQGQLGSLAALTAPRLLQTGSTGTSAGTGTGSSTGTGTTTQSGDFWQNLLLGGMQAGGQMGSAAIA